MPSLDESMIQPVDETKLPPEISEARQVARSALNESRIVAQMLRRLRSARIFGADRTVAGPKDSVALQVLFRLADQVEKLESCPLGDDETEMERQSRIAAIVKQMGDFTRDMHVVGARVIDRAAKQQSEAARLMLADRHFRMKLEKETGNDLNALSDAQLQGLLDAQPVVILDEKEGHG
jgi:hypothetical protein